MRHLWSQLHLRLLLLILAVSVLGVGAQSYLIARYRQGHLATTLQQEARRTAQQAAAHYKQVVSEARQLLAILASVPAVKGGSPDECRVFLQSVLPDRPQYLGLGVVGSDGFLTCSDRPLPAPVSIADRPYFQRVLATRAFSVGEYQIGRLTAMPSLNLGYPLRDEDGSLRGVVVGALGLDRLNQFAAEAGLPPGSELSVFDRQGTVLVRYPAGEGIVGTSLIDRPVVERILAEKSGMAIEADPDGKRRLFGYQEIWADSFSPIYMLVGIPESQVLQQVQLLTDTLMWQVLLSGLCALAAWAWGGWVLVRPLRALVGVARRFAAGNLAVRSGLQHSAGELGELAHAFDEMATSLQRRYDQMQALAHSGSTLGATLEIDAVLGAICQEALRVLRADAVSIFQPEPETSDWRILASRGLSAAYVASAVIPEPIIRSAFLERGPAISFDDLPGDYPARATAYQNEGVSTALVTAMRYQDKLAGMLVLYNKTADCRFNRNDHATALSFAGMAAAALANARLFAQARNRLDYLQALREIDVALLSGPKLQRNLDIVAQQATAQLQVDAAAIWLADEQNAGLTLAAARGFDSANVPHLALAGEHGQQVTLPTEMLLVRDGQETERSSVLRAGSAETYPAHVLVPLRNQGRVRGLLGLFKRSRLTPEPEWLDFAGALGGHAAIAIDLARMFEGVQQAHADLTVAYDNTLAGWSRALDLRDRETEGHSQRVAGDAVRLAEAMGLKAEELVHVRRGALLHDVGKLGIPDDILLKPGPLTPDEWETMKQHPLLAYQWLSPIDFLRPSLDIPYCHHERWDGKGYPRGRAGTFIPLTARVFAVVDVWDALRSNRRYRPAWSDEQAYEYIITRAGQHFDPEVVVVFAKHIAAIRQAAAAASPEQEPRA